MDVARFGVCPFTTAQVLLQGKPPSFFLKEKGSKKNFRSLPRIAE